MKIFSNKISKTNKNAINLRKSKQNHFLIQNSDMFKHKLLYLKSFYIFTIFL
jgi:hypothetical protein